jgi:hypothetical protein
MFKNLLTRLFNHRSCEMDAATKWPNALLTDSRGLTRFQHLAHAELEVALGQFPLELRGGKERYLTGTLPNSDAVLYLYEDGAEISGDLTRFHAERWDYNTPSALIKELVNRATKASA